jgi:hypothetical protein
MRAQVGYGLPTLADLDRAWTQKLKPTIIDGGYGDWLPTKGPGARGGRGPTLTMYDPITGRKSGDIVFMAGGAYSMTVRTVLVDEVDQFRLSNGEPMWESLEDMFHRADSYGRSAMRIAVGTIEHDTNSIILPLIDEHATGTRLWPRCQHCGLHIPYDWETFDYDATDDMSAIETAHIACKHCGVEIYDEDRICGLHEALPVHGGQSVERGEVIGPEPRTTSLGFLWTALESCLVTLGEVALEHRTAANALANSGHHGLIRKFTRYRKCMVYLDDLVDDLMDVDKISESHLEALSQRGWAEYLSEKDPRLFSRYFAQSQPEGIDNLSIGCDVQGDRIYWQVTGWSDGFRTYDMGFGYEHIPKTSDRLTPFAVGDWKTVLERIRDEIIPRFQGNWICKVCDTGFQADEISRFISENKDWFAVIGRKKLPKKSKTNKICAENLLALCKNPLFANGQYIVEDAASMQAMQAMYLRKPGDPDSCAIGSGLNRNAAYILHISCWQYVDGKYKAIRSRDDYADCKKYQVAITKHLLGAYATTSGKKRKRRRVAGVFIGGQRVT